MQHPRALPTLLPTLLMVLGCTPLRQYRCDYPKSPALTLAEKLELANPERAHQIRKACSPAFQIKGSTLVGFVEFDDVGGYWDIGQRDYVLAELRERLSEQPYIVVVFVHGWNHNAEECDTNLMCFRQFLDYLDKIEKQRATAADGDERPRPIAGVYVGWRGAAYKQVRGSLLYNWTSFWGRKRTAHAVGGAGGVTDLLSKIEKISTPIQPLDHPEFGSKLITVGHSFGGAVVFDSVGQVLISRSAAGDAKFGDLVVLVNPAFEASRADLFDARFKSPSVRYGGPGLVVFASERDWHNQTLFPIGRSISSAAWRHEPSTI
jgi:hypothetical protein